ncbi:MAG: Cys-Cys-COOH (seleno)protein SaoC [Syntrophomonas sp.]
MNIRLWSGIITSCLLLFISLLAGCGGNSTYERPVAPEQGKYYSEALKHWQQQYPGFKPVKWAEGDLNQDGRQDTVIIYQLKKDKCGMRVIFDLGEKGFKITDQTQAPVSNQQIQFKDIDDKPPIELIVSGMKDSNIGYAIYKWQDGQLINLFAENMDKCC